MLADRLKMVEKECFTFTDPPDICGGTMSSRKMNIYRAPFMGRGDSPPHQAYIIVGPKTARVPEKYVLSGIGC